MLRKEFNDQLKQALFMVFFVLGVTLLSAVLAAMFDWAIAYKEVFIASYQVGLLIFAIISGLSLFSSEKNQGGVEYVLTLPMSRYGLLFAKVIPRLAALTGLFLLYLLLSMLLGTQGLAAISPGLPTAALFYAVSSLFIISLSLSVCHQNFVLLAIVAIFAALVHFFFLFAALYKLMEHVFHRYLFFEWPWSMLVGIIGVLLPLAISFFVAFKKFDIRTPRGFNRKFRKVFVPLLLIGLTVSFVLFYSLSDNWYQRYHLTQDNRLIKYNSTSATIYDGKDSKKIKLDFETYWNFFEDKGSLYVLAYSGPNKGIYKINNRTFQLDPDPIFESKKLPRYGSLKKYKNTLAFIIRGTVYDPEKDFYILDLGTLATKKLNLQELLPAGYLGARTFGAGELEGKRFWLFCSSKLNRFPIVRVWEEGKVETLGFSLTKPGFYNNLLITTSKEGLELSRLTTEGKELVKQFPQGRKISLLDHWGRNLENEPIKMLYVTERINMIKSMIFSLDLDSLELKPVDQWAGHVRYTHPNNYVMVKMGSVEPSRDAYVTKIARIKNNKIEIIEEFPLEDRVIYHYGFGNGLVLEKDGKLWAYTYPDFKQITFKE